MLFLPPGELVSSFPGKNGTEGTIMMEGSVKRIFTGSWLGFALVMAITIGMM